MSAFCIVVAFVFAPALTALAFNHSSAVLTGRLRRTTARQVLIETAIAVSVAALAYWMSHE